MTYLPQDLVAEQTLAAMAALSHHGATIAHSVLEHIVDPQCHAVITAAIELDNTLGHEDRINTIALDAEVPRTEVDKWIAHCPCMWDQTGTWRALVQAATDRRQHALQLADELKLLVGAPIRFGSGDRLGGGQ